MKPMEMLVNITTTASLFYPVVSPASQAIAAETIGWPKGWAVQAAPIPTTASGKQLEGSNEVAIKRDPQGLPLAAIGLLRIARSDGGAARLDVEMLSVLNTIKSGYAAKGIKASCDTPGTTVFGSLPALQTLCSISQGDVIVLEQFAVVSMSAETVYNLTYSSTPVHFESYRADFTTMRTSLHLE